MTFSLFVTDFLTFPALDEHRLGYRSASDSFDEVFVGCFITVCSDRNSKQFFINVIAKQYCF